MVTEREGFSKSAVPGALSAPTALMIVAGATLALPAELQKAAALVPALKSNWLMMHVSVMMLSYATLLVGSLSCVAFLVVDASQGWSAAKGARSPKTSCPISYPPYSIPYIQCWFTSRLNPCTPYLNLEAPNP